jgi:hypothetical protein
MQQVKIIGTVFSLAAIVCSILAVSWIGLALLGFWAQEVLTKGRMVDQRLEQLDACDYGSSLPRHDLWPAKINDKSKTGRERNPDGGAQVMLRGAIGKECVRPALMGLSISHDIVVKLHGGSIEVDTQPGEFTEFKIILPRTVVTIS